MQFTIGLILFSFLFVLLFIIGILMVFRKPWLLVWLRANIGMMLIFAALAGMAGLFQLSDMNSLNTSPSLAKLQVRQVEMNPTMLRIKLERLGERDIELKQDFWRLSAISVQWSGLTKMLGVSDGIIVDEIQQSSDKVSVIATEIEHASVSRVWEFGRHYLQWLPGVKFTVMETEWFPSNLNTDYDLLVLRDELFLKDLNQEAQPGTAQILFEENDKQSGSDKQSDSSEAAEANESQSETQSDIETDIENKPDDAASEE